jgi:predicted metal-dependent phosphoesterase TrpH
VLKGVLHVHSVFSDGEESLERVVELIKLSGMQFTAVSDHAEVFDAERMKKYVGLCAALSDARFLVIPGLEFSLHGGNIHILGYGITRRVRFSNMEQLVDGIHAEGGIAVLAHPPAGATNLIGSIKAKLDGIEIWNGRYDGLHVPRASSIQLLRAVRSVNVKASAYGGVDLHKTGQAEKPIAVEVHTDELNRDAIITALASGRFNLRRGRLEVPASGNLSFMQEVSIAFKQPLCRPWAG